LPLAAVTPAWWRQFAERLADWTLDAGVSPRDLTVLLPFAQLLPWAREAWAGVSAGGWSPRFETPQMLAGALAPAHAGAATDVSFDVTTDRLTAAGLLRSQGWAVDWARADRRGFEQGVARMVETAHAFARAAAAVAPAERAVHWHRARTLLSPGGSVGGTERLLARVALEWAAASTAPATDVLFELRAGAWAGLVAGGRDPLVESVLQHAAGVGLRALRLVADADPLRPFEAVLTPRVAVATDAEDEAQRAAAQVLHHLEAGEAPVLLVAQDRVLVRRVHALLERSRVTVADESGWKLSTTRAGAAVMTLLRAARPLAGSDDWLDWFKSGMASWPALHAAGLAPAERIGRLEFHLRRTGATRAWGFDAQHAPRLHADAIGLWLAAREVLQPLQDLGRKSLPEALAVLRNALQACGAWEALSADAAGRQVLTALRLDPGAGNGVVWDTAARGARVDLGGLLAWVDDVLEQVSFRPDPLEGAAADVVITPLARAVLRPFAAVVMPGADENHLGAPGSGSPLVGESAAAELGLPTQQERSESELLVFALLLRHPQLTLLRRRSEGDQPLAPSPLLERLLLRFQRSGLHLPQASDPRPTEMVQPRPQHMPQPVLAGNARQALWPRRLDATAYAHLRACPYRFVALRSMGLREADELDDTVEARDYGTWLHAVLHRFHADRLASPWPDADDLARLLGSARAVQAEQGWDDAEFLPFATAFERLAPQYVHWLHEQEKAGARFVEGEVELGWQPDDLALPGLPPTQLHGRLDRVDRVREGGQSLVRIVDYKAGSAARLKEKLAEPLEDTQLPFYAALLEGARYGSHEDTGVEAGYLSLDGAEVRWLPHEAVGETAQQLLEGMAQDLQRIAAGAALPALGEGVACEYCAARGLCRRDHWVPSGEVDR
jgi:ATP-dependent helicase/nuclease subunit B